MTVCFVGSDKLLQIEDTRINIEANIRGKLAHCETILSVSYFFNWLIELLSSREFS